ncbi:MAG: hypothetical protein ACOC1O_02905, partial [bacterium]
MRFGINIFTLIFTLILLIFLFSPTNAQENMGYTLDNSLNLNDHIKNWLHIQSNLTNFKMENTHLHAKTEVISFYEKRDYNPVWVNQKGLFPRGQQLFTLLSNSNKQALNPKDYHLSALINLWRNINENKAGNSTYDILAQMEILFTDAFLVYISDLHSGRVDPESLERVWVKKSSLNLINFLEHTINNNELSQVNEKLSPDSASFEKLYDILDKYKTISRTGGWVDLDEETTLHPGDSHDNVKDLRKRLQQEPYQ